MANDAVEAYKTDRLDEEAATTLSRSELKEAKRRERYEAYLAQFEGQPAESAAAPDATAAPTDAPAEAPDPNIVQPEPLAPKTMPTSEDVKRSILRGPGKAAANFVDFGARGLSSALEATGIKAGLEYLGVDPSAFEAGTRTGDLFDATFGKPQTAAGQAAQEISGFLVPMTKYMAAVGQTSRIRYLSHALLGQAVIQTTMTSDKTPGLSNIGASMPKDHWANNWLTELLAVENDDNGLQKFTKRTTENLILNGVAEGTAKVVGGAIGRIAKIRGDKKAIASSAAEQGLETDTAVEAALDRMTAAKSEGEVLATTADDLAPPPAAAAPEAPPVAALTPDDLAHNEAIQNTLDGINDEIEAVTNTLGAKNLTPEETSALNVELRGLEEQRAMLQAEVKTVPKQAAPKAAPAAPKAAPAAPPAKLPQALAGAKPRYNVGQRWFKPVFESDIDKAAYIAAQKTRSKSDAAYVAWGQEVTGMTEAEFRAHGLAVKQRLKELAKVTESGDMQVPSVWGNRPRVGGPLPDPAAPAPTVVPKAPVAAPETTAAPAGTPAQPAPDMPPTAVTEAVEKQKTALKEAESSASEDFVRAVEVSNADPAVLRAYKDSAREAGHQFTPEQMARIDAVIAARTKAAVPIPKDQPFGAHLKITAPQMGNFKAALLAGDLHGATGILGEIIGDSTNFNKIVASGDVTDLLAAMMDEFGKDPNSYRILESRSRPATFATAEAELQALAKEFGSDANAIRIALEKQFPGRDLTKTLTAYRMLEVALAEKSVEFAKKIMAAGDGALAAEEELTRYLALTAIVNDRRAGLVSDIGRALNSLQKAAAIPNGVVLRKAAAEARNQGLEAFIKSNGGGRKNIQRLAEMIASGGNPEQTAALTRKASKLLAGTLGDALYAFVIHNTLSGPLSAVKNVSSSAFYQGVWKPLSNMAGGLARDMFGAATGGDVGALRREWIRTRATYAAARKVLSQDSMIRRNMREAWQTGQRVSAPGGAFMEHLGEVGKVTRLGEGNMARATELARTLRAGGQFQIPFTRQRVNLGAAIFGQNRLNKMATALDASAATRRLWSPLSDDPMKELSKRYGYPAKLIDYAGRVNSWPMHAMAMGDEFNASIAKSAALEAEAFEAVRRLGLDPDAAEAYMKDVIENIEDIPMLEARAADGALDGEAMRRLEIMQDIAAKADDYVRQMTFTEAPGMITQAIAHVRSLPIGSRWMLYFVRTPGNIARAGVRESPVGRVAQMGLAAARGDAAELAEQTGRAAFAGAVALSAWEVVTSGRMTGAGPSDPEAFALWQAEGNSPYTLRVDTPLGPKMLNYGSYVDPVAIPLQVVADLVESFEYMDEETAAAYAAEFTQRFSRLLESKSYMGSVVDAIDFITGRGSRTDTLVRMSKNFVPQSRLLATLRTNGLPVPIGVTRAIFGAPDENEEVGSFQEFLEGRATKNVVDRGRGVKLNENGELVDMHDGIIDSPTMVHFVSSVAEDLPAGFAEEWLEFHARVLGVRAQHGNFPQRDQLGEPRVLPIGYGPMNATGLLAGEVDPVRQELINVGMDKSVRETFGQYLGQELTPAQQDAYQRFYRQPTKDSLTAYELFQNRINSPEYKRLGETVGNIKGGRAKILEAIHDSRMNVAKAMLMREFPELKQLWIEKTKQKAQMMSQAGSDALKEEQAQRAPALLKMFQEAVNGGQ